MFLLVALVGAVAASLLACIPALHIYNVAGLLLLLGAGASRWMDAESLSALMIGLVTGYAIVNALPGVFLAVPDESVLFIMLPGQKYLLQGRGMEAVLLTGAGGLGGILLLALLTPVSSQVAPAARALLQPHLHWILAAATLFLLLSEWPKGAGRARTPLGRLAEGWRSLGAGLLTFLLSGLLGMVLMFRGPLPAARAYQNLAPAFIGLFAVPQLCLNILSRASVPRQHATHSVGATAPLILRGTLAGAAGGLFAAFFPAVTGGVGGMLAGHATAQRDDRLFLISQGASKAVYYVGGLLLFFVPGLHLTRGGMAWMLSSVYYPFAPAHYVRAMAAALLSAAAAFFLLLALGNVAARVIPRLNYQRLSAATLVLLAGLVLIVTGPGGLLVAAVGTGIGFLPVLWGSRRMNCLGLVLLPVMLNMAGMGDMVAGWLGLM
jgi:putative membrane protein